MAAALALFAGPNWYELAAALAMTALVDLATWIIAEYHHYAQRRHMARSRWVGALFILALLISMALNGAYLYVHRPTQGQLPELVSILIAIFFSIFVPMLIGVASLSRGELEDDRLRIQQSTAQQRSELALLRDDIAQAHAELARVRGELAHARADGAQYEEELAQARALVVQAQEQDAQLAREYAQANEQLARTTTQLAQANEQLAQLEHELAQPIVIDGLDVLTIARRLLDAGLSTRETARLIGMKDSTMRSRLKMAA
jgi:hypothetical protein